MKKRLTKTGQTELKKIIKETCDAQIDNFCKDLFLKKPVADWSDEEALIVDIVSNVEATLIKATCPDI